jgi:hypothetical protein
MIKMKREYRLLGIGLSFVLIATLTFLLGVALATGSSGVTAIELGMALMLVGLFAAWHGVHKLHLYGMLSPAFWRERLPGRVQAPLPAWVFEQRKSILKHLLCEFARRRNQRP